jgi:hypothetical protein
MEFEDINNTIREETKACTQKLKDRIRELNIKHISTPENADPLTKITNTFSNQAGMINRIRFKFKKSGVFVHKGVGRGTKASQVGSTKRVAKEWFNPVVETFADELTEKIADAEVNVVFDKLLIK